MASGIAWKLDSTPRRRTLLFWISAATIGSFLLSLVLTSYRPSWAFFSSPTRVWQFSLGALGVLVPSVSPYALPTPSSRAPNALSAILHFVRSQKNELLALAGLAGILGSSLLFGSKMPFPGVVALLPTVSTVLVLRACTGDCRNQVESLLHWQPFQEIGRLSYSWYLWHWPFLVFAATFNEDLGFGIKLLLVLVSLLFAELSYRWVEDPLRHNSFLSATSFRSIAMGVLLASLCGLLAFGWKITHPGWAASSEQGMYSEARSQIPSVYKRKCHVSFFKQSPQIKDCTTESSEDQPTIVLYGDSHAAQWYLPLDQIAKDKGWRLISVTKSSCPYYEIAMHNPQLGRMYDECTTWRGRVLDSLDAVDPDLILATSYPHYDLSERQKQVGRQRFIERFSSVSSSIAFISEIPTPGFDVPVCLARRDWRPSFLSPSCSITLKEADSRIVQTGSSSPVVDVRSKILRDLERDGLTRGNMVLFRDRHHVTTAYSNRFYSIFYNKIDSILSKIKRHNR